MSRSANRRWRVLLFIAEYMDAETWAPSRREIARALGDDGAWSLSVVTGHLRRLQRLGYLRARRERWVAPDTSDRVGAVPDRLDAGDVATEGRMSDHYATAYTRE